MTEHAAKAILVTGATGFLGSALVAELLARGRQLYATVRPQSDRSRIAKVAQNSALKLLPPTDEALEEAFGSGEVGTIIHAATEYGRGGGSIASILEANLLLPIRLAEFGIRHSTKTFINIDSFFNKLNNSYSNLLNYSLSKRTLLTWLERLSSNIGVANVVLEHIYGPNDSRSKFVEGIIQDVAVNPVPGIDLTHGHQRRDFIYISDVVSAIVAITQWTEQHTFTSKTFEVGTGKSCQIRDLVELAAAVTNSPTHLRFGAIPYRADEIMSSHADTRAMSDLGWKAEVSLEEGVRKILGCYGVDATG